LRDDASQIIRKANELGFKMIHLVTNGQQFNDYEKMEALLREGVNKLTMSLHSSNSADEERITNSRNSFPMKVAAIKNIMKYIEVNNLGDDFVFSVNTVLTPFTLPKISRLIRFLGESGIKRQNIFFPRIHDHIIEEFDTLVPWCKDLSLPIYRGMIVSGQYNINISLVDIPPCVIPENAGSALNRIEKNILTINTSNALGNVIFNVCGEKIKNSFCEECSRVSTCEGVFKKYVEKRGWDEFAPLP
jgi:MoaA/NifB/PqqE/SkfB family radical SAM enzyme